MIDEEGNDVFQIPFNEIENFVCDTVNGLPNIIKYPLVRMSRSKDEFKDVGYRSRGYTRYIINQLQPIYDPNTIIESLCENFGNNGPKYPVVGALQLGTLEKSKLQNKC